MDLAHRLFIGAVGFTVCLLGVLQVRSQETQAASIAVPVVFPHTLDASKATVGHTITAKTIQLVQLPDGTQLPKGSVLLGHVTAARAFSFDPAPYAAQQPSILSVKFDKVTTNGGATIQVSVAARVLANRIESDNASIAHRLDETDSVDGTRVLVGGDTFNPLEKPIVNSQGDIVGYNRRDGVFARLLPAQYTSRYSQLKCEGNDAEQAVAIFSANACGLYGFPDDYLTDNGSHQSQDSFRLESRKHSVKIDARSTALLQVIVLSRDSGS